MRTPLRPAATPVDESELLARLRAGEDAAYETLVREHGGRLLAVARRILRDEDEARDAVQEAFTSAFRGIGGFSGESRLGTWLHRITVNHALMRLRSRRRRPEDPIDPLLPVFREDGHLGDPVGEWREIPDTRLARGELAVLVRRAVDRLPETYRTVLVLRDIEELDTAETAEMLGISPSAVKTRLHRARLALRELLDPALREDTS